MIQRVITLSVMCILFVSAIQGMENTQSIKMIFQDGNIAYYTPGDISKSSLLQDIIDDTPPQGLAAGFMIACNLAKKEFVSRVEVLDLRDLSLHDVHLNKQALDIALGIVPLCIDTKNGINLWKAIEILKIHDKDLIQKSIIVAGCNDDALLNTAEFAYKIDEVKKSSCLNLSSLKITDANLECIQHLLVNNTIKAVDLSNNELTTININEFFSWFNAIKELNLSNNSIASFKVDQTLAGAPIQGVIIDVYNNALSSNEISNLKFHLRPSLLQSFRPELQALTDRHFFWQLGRCVMIGHTLIVSSIGLSMLFYMVRTMGISIKQSSPTFNVYLPSFRLIGFFPVFAAAITLTRAISNRLLLGHAYERFKYSKIIVNNNSCKERGLL